MAMFSKILIANRGEIACRVMRTARRMGIATVAVYSEVDRDAVHVEMADEAVAIGPAAAAESYLVAERILDACRETGAEAVHPGYGFLSENAAFAELLADAGIAFVGPGAHAIVSMGDKITSKGIAAEAGVSTIPGHPGALADAERAIEAARGIGYPVMLKASAGGGGKGMRIARDDDQCQEGFERASSEARSSFGDGRIFVEKFVEGPRHVEIQVLADGHGNCLYLGERECSIQRRHQKVLEEAPSPAIDAATRRAMGEQAVALARAVDYRSAGTVEFVLDPEGRFYFLEMNTRLQVEHPVTELVTGLDLVEWMIRIAAGERLDFGQDDVALDGWALEARVYAENALRGFVPSTGRLVRYLPPADAPGVRVDAGVTEGGDISVYYDPMIAKLVTHGATRDEAIERMRRALDEYYVRGVHTNLSFLSAVVHHPRFVAGRLSTDFIDEEYPRGFGSGDAHRDAPDLFVVVAAAIHARYRARAFEIEGQMPGCRREIPPDWVVWVDGEYHPVRIEPIEHGHAVVHAGREHAVRSEWQFGQALFRGTVDGEERCLQVERRGLGYQLFQGGIEVDVLVLAPHAAAMHRLMPEKQPPDLSGFLLSPMPGLLLSLEVAPGDEVREGDEIAVVEAMKMENVLRASEDRVVKAVHAKPGDSLAVDQPIVEFE